MSDKQPQLTGFNVVAKDMGLDIDSPALAANYNAGYDATKPGQSVIGFSLPTREAVDERNTELLASGYRGLQEPWDAFWGARYAIIEDPDGNAVGIMSPVDDALRSTPPDL